MGALDGIRVLDLSRLAPGPYCTMLLGDMGADVIRVDSPQGTVRAGDMLSRNKRSIVLDLKKPEAQAVLHRLAATADVLLESNRPGVTKRLGCDPATLAAINPRLVYCSLTGYGQEGPLSGAAGHDINYISISGVLSQIGDGKAPPVPPLNLVADFGGGGLLAAFGIVCALLERQRSGQGQTIDTAMIDGAASLMSVHYATDGRLSAPGVGMLGGGAPFYGTYECRDGKYVAVGAIEPKFFAALCRGTGLDFVAEQMETSRWQEQKVAFAKRFLEHTRDEWVDKFKSLDACLTPVLDLDEARHHPHNVERIGFPKGPDGRPHTAPAPRLDRTPGSIRSREPEIGEHTEEILLQAGYTAEEIEALSASGATERTQAAERR